MSTSSIVAQTDTQTHRYDENITSTAYAGGNKMGLEGALCEEKNLV